MAAVFKVWRFIKNLNPQQNDRAKLHPDPIWNNSALGFLKRVARTTIEQQQDE